MRLLLALFLGLTLSPPLPAQSTDDLLPVEEAFVLDASVPEPGRVALRWEIAPDYYLYRSRIKVKSTQDGVTLGAPDLPPGEPRHDEFLGDVEIYHGTVEASLPFTASAGTTTLDLTVTVQGCHEVEPKICYPPHPTKLTLALPANDTPAAAAPLAGSAAPSLPLIRLGGDSAGAVDDAPLPAEEAFVFEAIAASPTSILARWTMPKGYYLYRDKSVLALRDADDVQLGAPQWRSGVPHADEHFGTVEVYFDEIELPIPLRRERGEPQAITLHAEYQGCQENGLCYPVMERDITIDLPAATADQLASASASFVPAAAANPASADDQVSPAPTAASAGSGGLLGALLLAVLGGLLLNLMPCVLPVLSLKVLGLAQSGESREKARSHALWYTAGVLVSFAAVGLVVIALRSAGQALGWGFQLQQPLFVAVLAYVMFAVGLSMSGVIHFGAGLAGAGSGLASRSGAVGDFFTGVLAVVVASPCTIPIMGSALAFALASSSLVALPVFLALGLGLALPFLLVGFVPALASRLPRPGAWMETLKQLLAFPMYLTAVWLLWILGNQKGVDAIAWALVGMTALALGLWWWERSRYRGGLARKVLAFAIVAASFHPLSQAMHGEAPKAATTASSEWVPYSAERLASLRAEGRGVFVDMTADWCVTCKVNEKAVLHTDAFRDLMARTDTVAMQGDWTNVDPEISAFLKTYDSPGVPLYVVFRPGVQGEGEKLPSVLTFGIVERAVTGTGG